MHVLIILGIEPGGETRSAPEFDGLLEAYYLLSDAGLALVIASPAGGSAWAGPSSDEAGGDAARRFRSDSRARDILNDLLCLDDVYAEDFAAALCLGFGRFEWGVGVEDRAGVLIIELLALGRPVAVISPSAGLTMADVGRGLLIIGQAAQAPGLAAKALLGLLQRSA